MTTKPKLKKIPLPEGLSKLPKGAVFLGRGREELERAKASPFDAWTHLANEPDPKGWEPQRNRAGCAEHLYYAAPADSAIAREILGTKRKAAKKTITKPSKTITKPVKAQKTITLRKLPKNVKPGTKVVCIDSGIGGLFHEDERVRKGMSYTITNNDMEGMVCVGGKWLWDANRFRLAPDKKPRVQRSKRIGVMPAPAAPIQNAVLQDSIRLRFEKFGVEFCQIAERDGIDLPDWLPALPPVPSGHDRWEPRGPEWASDRECLYGYALELEQCFVAHSEARLSLGTADFYIEAVRDEKPEAATENASVHIELHQKEISRIGSPTPYAADYWPQKAEEIRRNSAVGLLNEAAETIGARAAERDVESERSMAKCVSAFNVMFGKDITEEQGWLFMVLLKMSRSTVGHRRDDFLDGAAYMSLAGECALSQEKP